jgi:hypothetical protein
MRRIRPSARALTALALSGLMAVTVLAFAAPAGAVADEAWEYIPTRISGTYQPIVGDFTGDLGAASQTEILWYGKGDAPDTLFTGVGRTFTSTHLTINGRYRPLVGDFAGDIHDDVLLYGTGNAPDTLWVGGPGARFPTSTVAVNIKGDYRAVALRDFHAADSKDRILWYAPGSTADSEWQFASSGDGSHTSAGLKINGNFQTVPGFYNDDDIEDVFFYAAGSANDYLWTGKVGGGFTSTPKPVNGTYEPAVVAVPGGDAILWWADGPATDRYWRSMGLASTRTPQFSAVGTVYGDPLGGTLAAIPDDLEIGMFEFEGENEPFDLSPSGRDIGDGVRPLQGDFDGDGLLDIFWYGAGSKPDEVWYQQPFEPTANPGGARLRSSFHNKR